MGRDAVSRARFFLGKAQDCSADERDDFEAYLEAAIVFARTAIHRLKSQFESNREWKVWWDGLLADPSLQFIRDERDWILKEAPPRIGQVAYGGRQPEDAAAFYYYEHRTPATETV